MKQSCSKLFDQLRGEHASGRSERIGNWLSIWAFVVITIVVVGIVDASVNRSEAIPMSLLALSAGAGACAGWCVIRALNATRVIITGLSMACLRTWPLRSWEVRAIDVRDIRFETVRGGRWVLVLEPRNGRRRRVAMTKSMRDALELT